MDSKELFSEQLPLPLRDIDDPLRDGFMTLSHDLRPHMERAFRRHGLQVYRRFKVGAELHALVDHRAISYARQRAGELIKDFSASTPQMLRSTVVKALEERWSAQQLRDELRGNQAFSPVRALNIARTELQEAHRAGGFAAAKAAGAEEKHWRAGECRLCQENDEVGWIQIDDDFPNGGSPHPSCGCPIDYRAAPESETAPEE